MRESVALVYHGSKHDGLAMPSRSAVPSWSHPWSYDFCFERWRRLLLWLHAGERWAAAAGTR